MCMIRLNELYKKYKMEKEFYLNAVRLFLSSPFDRRLFLMIAEECQFHWLKEENLKNKNNLWYCVIVFYFFLG
jgi:hypothetical protein